MSLPSRMFVPGRVHPLASAFARRLSAAAAAAAVAGVLIIVAVPRPLLLL